MRSHLVRLVAAGTTLLVVMACAGPSGTPSTTSGSPLKIGMIEPMSGTYAEAGQDHVLGAQVAVDQINKAGGILGRKVELVVKDDQFQPTLELQAMRDFSSQGINLTAGYQTSAGCVGAATVAQELKILEMAACGTQDLNNPPGFSKNAFRPAGGNFTILNNAVATFAFQKFGSQITTWDALVPDYAAGRQSWDAFQAGMKKLQPNFKAGKAVFVPLTATDVQPYLSSMTSAVPDNSGHGLFLATFAALTALVVKTGKPLKLFNRFSATVNLFGSEPVVNQLGADFPDVWMVYDYYWKAFDNPANKKFVDDFNASTSKIPHPWGSGPDWWSWNGYASVMAIKAGVEAAKSTDTDKVIKALEGISYDAAVGTKITIRASDHQAIKEPIVGYECKGDASKSGGYECSNWLVIPGSQVEA